MDPLIVDDGGVLILLGIAARDVTVKPGGTVYIYGMVAGNVLNFGGYLEVYGFVSGYIYTDVDGITIVDPDAIVIATPPSVTPTPFPTVTPAIPTPTPIVSSVTPTPFSTVTPVTPTPMPTATPAPDVGVIDLSISLYKSAPTQTEREPYEEILAYFADAIYEVSNGAHKVRTVTIYQNGSHADTADVVWTTQEWPRAFINGYGVPGYSVYMGDYFDSLDFTTDRRCGGYVLAHEWGHYYYGVYDEYQAGPGNPCASDDVGCPRPDDKPVRNSVMNDSWRACRGGDLNWLNFSVPKNQTRDNAQYRVFNASAWETLARPTSQDPRSAARMALRERSYYPELVDAAPVGNHDASLELTVAGASTQARDMLNIVWVDDATAAIADVPHSAAILPSSAGFTYHGSIESVLGASLDYPTPLLLVAKVVNGTPIAKVNVSAGVLSPDGSIHKVVLKDNGVAPDVLADDGLYSGYVTYTQAGTYYAFARFDNRDGLAEFTEESLEHAPGPDGETNYPEPRLVGDDFFAVGNAVITVNNVHADDHGNTPTDATSLPIDNVDILGRIDYAGDVDVFVVTPPRSGKLVLRLSGFAFDMQPHVQILRSDGVKTRKTYEFIPAEGRYFFTSLRGRADKTFYIAVRHLDTAAIGGMYDISIGPALPNVVESPPLGWLLIVLPLVGAGLFAVYLFMRPRPVPRQVVAPRRRTYVPAPPRRAQPVDTKGQAIYKQAEDKEEENEEDTSAE